MTNEIAALFLRGTDFYFYFNDLITDYELMVIKNRL